MGGYKDTKVRGERERQTDRQTDRDRKNKQTE